MLLGRNSPIGLSSRKECGRIYIDNPLGFYIDNPLGFLFSFLLLAMNIGFFKPVIVIKFLDGVFSFKLIEG